jgi:hypothetical protein
MKARMGSVDANTLRIFGVAMIPMLESEGDIYIWQLNKRYTECNWLEPIRISIEN